MKALIIAACVIAAAAGAYLGRVIWLTRDHTPAGPDDSTTGQPFIR